MRETVWQVVVHVRKRGAIGIHYDQRFQVSAPENASNNEIIDKWYKQFGDEYEPHHVVSINGPF